MPAPHISVCICTFRRPKLLEQLLVKLASQRTEDLFSFSVVVADNDAERSAKPVLTAFCSTHELPVTYGVEPRQNIALARNKALEHAEGDFIAFIDDDEFPEPGWLATLFKTCVASGADAVLGPVKPHFESEPPRWVRRGAFFERPAYATGYKLNWNETRTGNVLFKRDILKRLDMPFRPAFDVAGEDVDFFRRLAEKGCSFVWCNEAVAWETVPACRCTRAYLLKRSLLRGSNSHPPHPLMHAGKSLIAVLCYSLLLPVFVLTGQHVFVKYLMKLLYHAAWLFAHLGFKPVTERTT